jgi:hypothetical protein
MIQFPPDTDDLDFDPYTIEIPQCRKRGRPPGTKREALPCPFAAEGRVNPCDWSTAKSKSSV